MLRIVLLFVAMGVLACCSTASAQDQPGDIITDGAGNLFVLVDQTGDGVPDVAVAVYPPPADPPPVDPPVDPPFPFDNPQWYLDDMYFEEIYGLPAPPPPVDPPSLPALVSIVFIEFITDDIEIIRGY